MKTNLNDPYFTTQIMTCIGNKRKLLPYIDEMIQYVKLATHKDMLVTADLFCGSGIVTRLLAKNSSFIYANDLEKYAAYATDFHLNNHYNINEEYWNYYLRGIEKFEPQKHFFLNNYAPKDENNITKDDRVFFTRKNADYIDKVVEYCQVWFDKDSIYTDYKYALLGRLIEEASIHCNTTGVFKGFLKDKNTHIGKYGGTNENCLERIKGDITLTYPVLLDREIKRADFIGSTHIADANSKDTIWSVNFNETLDLVYLDPPYNGHPYGSNYFMLNLIANYNNLDVDNLELSKVSGIPKNWNRSKYNNQKFALSELEQLIKDIHSKFFLLSYNNQGFISYEEIVTMLSKYGRLTIKDIDYPAYRGGRKTGETKKKTKKYLFLLEKYDEMTISHIDGPFISQTQQNIAIQAQGEE